MNTQNNKDNTVYIPPLSTTTLLNHYYNATKRLEVSYEDKKTDTEFYFKQDTENSKRAFISFWGATSFKDFTQAVLRCSPSPYLGCYVHTGTLHKWLSICEEVRELIEVNKITKITCSAFSQGASMALLFYLWLRRKFPNIEAEVVLFGNYKVIYRDDDNIFSDRIAKHNLFTYYISNDLVHKWPFFITSNDKIIKNSINLGKSDYPFFRYIKIHMDFERVILLKK